MNAKTKPIGYLDWQLNVDCPRCQDNFDAVDVDAQNGYIIAKRVFSNQWDDVAGCELTCPNCGHEFELGGIEY